MKIAFFGSCQLHLCSNFFINDIIKNENNIELIFNKPFYEYDDKFPEFKEELNYNIFDELDVLIIENNNLNNSASLYKIITYCLDKKIKIIKTCLIKFPIYPINWSGYGENIKDYINYKDLNEINYKEKFNNIISNLKKDFLNTNLDTGIITFIEENFNKKLLFTHSLHPTNILLFELWKSILNNLDININNYKFIFNYELIDCWYNPFTTKLVEDLNIQFQTIVDDNFYIERFNKNYNLLLNKHNENNNLFNNF